MEVCNNSDRVINHTNGLSALIHEYRPSDTYQIQCEDTEYSIWAMMSKDNYNYFQSVPYLTIMQTDSGRNFIDYFTVTQCSQMNKQNFESKQLNPKEATVTTTKNPFFQLPMA